MNYSDILVLILADSTIKKIGFVNFTFHKDFVINNISYAHFIGKIQVLEENFPVELKKIIEQKVDYVNDGVFSLIDDINLEINKYDIRLESKKCRIYDIYIENNGVDFVIPHAEISF